MTMLRATIIFTSGRPLTHCGSRSSVDESLDISRVLVSSSLELGAAISGSGRLVSPIPCRSFSGRAVLLACWDGDCISLRSGLLGAYQKEK